MSTKHDNRYDAPTITRRRHVLACARCRARRVKCDRAQPACSNCTKAGASCQPAQPQSTSLQPPPQPGKRESGAYGRYVNQEEEIGRRSRELESNTSSREVSAAPSADDFNETLLYEEQGRLAGGDPQKYFSPFSWAVISEDLTDFDMMFNDDFRSTDPTSISAASNDNVDLTSLPDEALHDILLSVYRHRVDPLVRILHWPTFFEQCQALRTRRTLQLHATTEPRFPSTYYTDPSRQTGYHTPAIVPSQGGVASYTTTTKSTSESAFVALLYAVYYAAAISIVDCPTAPDLGPDVTPLELAATFKKEIASRVMEMKTAQAVCLERLQAMVLCLSVEPSSFGLHLPWLQLGAVIRMAQALGVHRDGANFRIGPIEVEVRRRLWAQICVLDVRFAEQLGREPTLLPGSYDAILPLSIDDRDLADLDHQHIAARQGQETSFKSHQEVEQAQQLNSPLSPMTFSLVEVEISRLMSQIMVPRYQPRDRVSQPYFSRPSRSSAELRCDKRHWINRLEHRFRTLYGLDGLEASNPMHFLVLEIVGIAIAKARFVVNLMEWKEVRRSMSAQRRDSETASLFRDAIGIATRTLTLIHQFSSSPFRWYTKRFRDVYSSSFIAFNLASGQGMDQQHFSLGWSALDQLFPADVNGKLLEHSLADSSLGRVLLRAMSRRRSQSHLAGSTGFADISTGAATGHIFSSTSAPYSVSLPTSTEGIGAFPSTGNYFEDYDTMMQDPMWSSALGSMDSSYGPWTAQTASNTTLQITSERGPVHPSDGSHGERNFAFMPVSKPPGLTHIGPSQRHLPSVSIDLIDPMLQLESMHLSQANPPISSSRSVPVSPMSPSRTWPLQEDQLSVRFGRERAVSQPHQGNHLQVQTQKLSRTKSMTNTPGHSRHSSYTSSSSQQTEQGHFEQQRLQRSPFALRVNTNI